MTEDEMAGWHHQLTELTQTQVHRVHDAIQLSHPLSSPSLLPSIFPSIRVFSNESVICIRWPKYWRFSFSIIPSKEQVHQNSFLVLKIPWFYTWWQYPVYFRPGPDYPTYYISGDFRETQKIQTIPLIKQHITSHLIQENESSSSYKFLWTGLLGSPPQQVRKKIRSLKYLIYWQYLHSGSW